MSGARRASVEDMGHDIYVELSSLNLDWSEETISLKNFAKTFRTPEFIMICEGKFEDWGPNTEEDPDLYPLLFALCKRYKFKIAAQCVNVSGGRKYPTGPEFEIGDDFDGWFEIVSEDASPMFQIGSVSELAGHLEEPFVLMKSMHAHKRNDGEWETCTLDVGYEIKVGMWMPDRRVVRDCGCGKLLECESFHGEKVYLPLSEPGRFSLIGEDYLTGPQTISSLCSLKFPINVKLMEDSPRPTDFEGFVPTMVLLKANFEEVLVVWPMQRGVPLIHIPTECPMRLATLNNLQSVRESPLYKEIFRRIQTYLPQSKTRPRWFQHTQSSLVRSLLQKTSTTSASNRTRTTRRIPSATSAAEIRPPSTSSRVTFPSIDIHQPSTSGLLATSSTDIQQPGTYGFVTSTATTSRPFNPPTTNIQRSSNSRLPCTATTYLQKPNSITRDTEATIDIHQPSTSGLQSSSSVDVVRKLTSKKPFSKRSHSSSTKTSEEEDSQQRALDITSPRTYQVRSMEGRSTGTRADQQASGVSVHSDRLRPLSISPKRAGDEPWTSTPRASPKGKLHFEPMGGIDDERKFGHTTFQSSRNRSFRLATQIHRDNQQTSDLSVARSMKTGSKEPGGDQQTNVSRRSLRFKTQVQRDAQQTSDRSVAPSMKTGSKEAGEQQKIWAHRSLRIKQRDDEQSSDLSASRSVKSESKSVGPDEQAILACSLRIKSQEPRGNQETSGRAVAPLRKLRSRSIDDTDQQTYGQATVQQSRVRRSSGMKPLDHQDYRQTLTLATNPLDEDSSSETKESSSIDPYDEIDEIYAENKRTYIKRCNIPLEKETFL